MRASQLRAKFLASENSRWPRQLAPVPREQWPAPRGNMSGPIEAYRSMTFFVQVFEEPSGKRMTINRTVVERWADGLPIWREGISWDEMQRLKAGAGYGAWWAVECFPPDSEIVNVANMRHLWRLPAPPSFGWRKLASP